MHTTEMQPLMDFKDLEDIGNIKRGTWLEDMPEDDEDFDDFEQYLDTLSYIIKGKEYRLRHARVQPLRMVQDDFNACFQIDGLYQKSRTSQAYKFLDDSTVAGKSHVGGFEFRVLAFGNLEGGKLAWIVLIVKLNRDDLIDAQFAELTMHVSVSEHAARRYFKSRKFEEDEDDEVEDEDDEVEDEDA